MDIYDKEISNGVDPTHELRNDKELLLMNALLLI